VHSFDTEFDHESTVDKSLNASAFRLIQMIE
jgi:hypothetical protein